MAEAMYVLNRWLESPRSLGNSSLRERDEDSFTAAERVKIRTIKPVSRKYCECSSHFKSRLRSYSEKKPNRNVSCQEKKESPKDRPLFTHKIISHSYISHHSQLACFHIISQLHHLPYELPITTIPQNAAQPRDSFAKCNGS